MAIKLVPFTTRFADAIGLLCTETPSIELCREWLDDRSDDLQEWVIDRLRLSWAQGIGVIDAARLLAGEAEEGRPEFLTERGEVVARHLAASGPIAVVFKRNKWRAPQVPEGMIEHDIISFMSSGLCVRPDNNTIGLSPDYVF
ncbi:hypothetical protein ABIC83_002452 [Roseateles asaccharophilus]|uniref:hypothetical protein n=1 Tax=Roseateles asaccharophilus TaxID=582607 RepID=UPI0038334A24